LTNGDLVDDGRRLAVRARAGNRARPRRRTRPASAHLQLDEAHPAIAGDRQPLVEAEARDLRARLLAGLEERELGRDIDLDAIDDELGHDLSQ
jgi:hypothetical protein